jgi:hypothetical protein
MPHESWKIDEDMNPVFLVRCRAKYENGGSGSCTECGNADVIVWTSEKLVTEFQKEGFKIALDHEDVGSILIRNVCKDA